MNSGTVVAGKDGLTIERRIRDRRDRRSVADEVVRQFFKQGCVDGVKAIGEEKRVAIRTCADDCFGPNIVASAGPVVDDELLTKSP